MVSAALRGANAGKEEVTHSDLGLAVSSIKQSIADAQHLG